MEISIFEMRRSKTNQQSPHSAGVARDGVRGVKASAQSVARRVHRAPRTSGARQRPCLRAAPAGLARITRKLARGRGWARRGGAAAGGWSRREVGWHLDVPSSRGWWRRCWPHCWPQRCVPSHSHAGGASDQWSCYFRQRSKGSSAAMVRIASLSSATNLFQVEVLGFRAHRA